MRFLSTTFTILAIASAGLVTGCGTHDRVLYHYEPNPLRIKEPRLVKPEPKPEAGVVAPDMDSPLLR